MLNKKRINRPQIYIHTLADILEFPLFSRVYIAFTLNDRAPQATKKKAFSIFFFQHGLNTGYEFFNKYGIALFAF